jgi:hypothetical protein
MRMRTYFNRAIFFLAVALFFAAGGCGDDDGNGGGAGAAGGSADAGVTAGIGGTPGSGGTAGSSGNAGNGGTSGSGGMAGSGETAGTGGPAGSGGAAGGAGEAGSSGTAGSAGEAGSGGTAGAGGTAGSGGGAGGGGTGGAFACIDPVFVTSDTNGGWGDGDYYVHNNMWNVGSYDVTETLYACSYDNWYVVANANDDSGDGAVKTYPNVHVDYGSVPISSFNTITSTFAESSPHVGIYNVAYDIWVNGVATPGCTEFMIWNENFNQVPSGDKVTTVDLGGRTYDVWRTSSGGYIAFVPTEAFTSGTVDILEILNWAIAQGWIPGSSTLGQICFGVEIVSTDGSDATFHFTDFSITKS